MPVQANHAFDRTAGSHAFAAAGQRGRYPDSVENRWLIQSR